MIFSHYMILLAGLKCSECGYNCHEKCMSHVPKNCSSGIMKGIANGSNSTANSNKDSSNDQLLSPSDGKRHVFPVLVIQWSNVPMV